MRFENQDPVVKNIVRLKKSLIEDLLSLSVPTESNLVQFFLAEKNVRRFFTAKAPNIILAINDSVFKHNTFGKFNVSSLTTP